MNTLKKKVGWGPGEGEKKHTERASEGSSHRRETDKIKFISKCSMVFCFQYLLFQADAF